MAELAAPDPRPEPRRSPDAPTPQQTPVVNRLALRVAGTVALAVGLAGVAVGLLASGGRPLASLLAGLALASVAGIATYRAVAVRVSARLELARRTLREARKRRFDALATLSSAPDRDELDALVRQVYRAGRALQAEIERLETMETYRRDFLGDVSHELRTPIFAVSGFAETLLDGALDDDRVRRRFVEKILANARRLEALTRDLTDISKLETGRLQIVQAPFALRALVVEAVESLEGLAREQAVDVQVRIPEGLPPAEGDRDRIRQVVVNLVENAITYNRAGGHVEVAARVRTSGDLRVTVVDDGVGIPQDALPRLTDRFFRVDKSRARTRGGTGLGLAIVKHILEAHGQRLAVESRPGYGSSFAFSLPAAAIVEAERLPPRPDAARSDADRPPLRRPARAPGDAR